jgi:activator of 2-hydroxyglutaryl-CoA dehydratase
MKSFNTFITELQAVSGGKVHKYITGHDITVFGKKQVSVDFELLGIDNGSKTVKLKVLAPKEILGKELTVPFRLLRRGPFTKTDTSNPI